MYSIKSTIFLWLLLTIILLSSNILCTEEEVLDDGNKDYYFNRSILPMEEEPKPDPRRKRFRLTNDDKIIGGEIADPGSSPWIASIQDLNFEYPIHFCGAVIISNFFLLTAAFCVSQYSQPYEKIKVVVGEYNLAVPDGWEVDHTIKQVIIHPDYDPYFFWYDVAIIQVKEEIYFNTRIQPIHLPHHNEDNIYKHTDTANIYGWGKTLFIENNVDILRKAAIPTISFEECQHTAYGDIIDHPTMCAGDLLHGGVSSCTGDWGGPLVSQYYKDDPVLLGVSSFSIGCGEPDTPNFYVDVRMILDWIYDHTGQPPLNNSEMYLCL